MNSTQIKALRLAINAQLELAEKKAIEVEQVERNLTALKPVLALECDLIDLKQALMAEMN